MADANASVAVSHLSRGSYENSVSWVLATASQNGAAVRGSDYPDKTVHIFGTWLGGTLIMQGSNEDTPTSWISLTDGQGNSIEKTSDSMEVMQESPKWVRPSFAGGAAGSSVTVIMVGRLKRD